MGNMRKTTHKSLLQIHSGNSITLRDEAVVQGSSFQQAVALSQIHVLQELLIPEVSVRPNMALPCSSMPAVRDTDQGPSGPSGHKSL